MLVDSAVITTLGRIALMPTLVLAARICPEVRRSTTTAACLTSHGCRGGTAQWRVPVARIDPGFCSSVMLHGRQGVEATLYAALMSVCNASFNTAELLGALVTQLLGITAQNFANMPILISVSALCGFLTLPFLHFVRDTPSVLPNQEAA